MTQGLVSGQVQLIQFASKEATLQGNLSQATAALTAAKAALDGTSASQSAYNIALAAYKTALDAVKTAQDAVNPATSLASQALQNLNNILPLVASETDKLTAQATNQVASAEALTQSWINQNSVAQTTIQGQIALQNTFNQSKTALDALGITLTTTGATYTGTNTAVQAFVDKINAGITAMNNTPAAANNAAQAITGIGSAANSAAAAVNKLSEALSGVSVSGGGLETGANQVGGVNGQGGAAGGILDLYASLGATTSQLDSMAQAMGLVVTGFRQYEDAQTYNAQIVAAAAANTTLAVKTLANGIDILVPATSTNTDATNQNTTATAANTTAITTATTALDQFGLGLSAASSSTTTAVTDLSDTIEVTASNVDSSAQTIADAMMNGATTISFSADNLADSQSLYSQVVEDLSANGSALATEIQLNANATDNASAATGTLTVNTDALSTSTATNTTATDNNTSAVSAATNALTSLASAATGATNALSTTPSEQTVNGGSALSTAQTAGPAAFSLQAGESLYQIEQSLIAAGTPSAVVEPMAEALYAQENVLPDSVELGAANAANATSATIAATGASNEPSAAQTDSLIGTGPGSSGEVWSPTADAYVSEYGATAASDMSAASRAPTSNITFTGNTVIGDAGITTLANLVMQKMTTVLRQNGYKI